MPLYNVEITSPTTKQKVCIEVNAQSSEVAIARIRRATMTVLSWRESVGEKVWRVAQE